MGSFYGSVVHKFIGKFLKNARFVELEILRATLHAMKILARICGNFGYVMKLSSS